MRPDLCVYTLFEKSGKPLVAGTADVASGEITIHPLFIRNTGITVLAAKRRVDTIAKLIMVASRRDLKVAISGFKSHLNSFPIELATESYNVYDLCLPNLVGQQISYADATEIIQQALRRMMRTTLMEWHKVFANAAVVYQDLQNVGVKIGDVMHYPVWSQSTYSGRSKTSVVNIQGMTDADNLMRTFGSWSDMYIHFDWVAADIRVASLLSGDETLQQSFIDSDPYTFLEHALASETGSISRDDCKAVLLKSINSLAPPNDTIGYFFPTMCEWLRESVEKISTDGYLTNLLGRRFYLEDARDQNPRAVFNGVMQGSVASAMQCAVRRVWESFRNELLVEIHDSMVLCCLDTDKEYAADVIREVAAIMSRPFAGVLESNPMFPVKISIGKKYRQWKNLTTYRGDGKM